MVRDRGEHSGVTDEPGSDQNAEQIKNPHTAEGEPQVLNDEPLWTIEQLSDYLQIPIKTIRNWRDQGTGPRGRRLGRHLRFERADVLAWLDTR